MQLDEQQPTTTSSTTRTTTITISSTTTSETTSTESIPDRQYIIVGETKTSSPVVEDLTNADVWSLATPSIIIRAIPADCAPELFWNS